MDNSGRALWAEENLEAALEYVLTAVELDPSAGHLETLALIYHKLGMYDEALQFYSEALSLEANEADFYLRRGDSYAALGQTSEAIQDYERYLEMVPNSDMREEVVAKVAALE